MIKGLIFRKKENGIGILYNICPEPISLLTHEYHIASHLPPLLPPLIALTIVGILYSHDTKQPAIGW